MNKRFNANAVIEPNGKIHKCCCMNHLNILMEYGNFKSVQDQILEDCIEIIDLHKWQDSMYFEKGWMSVCGAEHYIDTVYRVVCGVSPTLKSVESLFQIMKESHEYGDLTTYIQLNEAYQKLIPSENN